MDLSTLPDGALLRKLENLTSFERSSLVLLLHCLREVEQRRLFSEAGYRSLFSYCVKSLRYSEDQAQRRIIAMRLLKELPEIEGEIESGGLNISAIGLFDTHFRQEGVSDNGIKLELLRQGYGKTLREIEKLLARSTAAGTRLRPDRIRSISETHIELRFVALSQLEEKIEVVRNSMAHSHSMLSLGKLFELLCDDKSKKANDSPPANSRVTPQQKKTRKRKPSLRRQVFTRDQHKCTRCGSTHALEVDHIVPRAKGGPDTLENLRLLCRSCNQRAAINEFGQEKMNQYM